MLQFCSIQTSAGKGYHSWLIWLFSVNCLCFLKHMSYRSWKLPWKLELKADTNVPSLFTCVWVMRFPLIILHQWFTESLTVQITNYRTKMTLLSARMLAREVIQVLCYLAERDLQFIINLLSWPSTLKPASYKRNFLHLCRRNWVTCKVSLNVLL